MEKLVRPMLVAGSVVLFVFGTAASAQVTVGTANTDNCFPFSCAASGFNQYQQVYGSAAFSGPLTIGSLSFFRNDATTAPGGTFASGTYNIFLSTTSKPVGGLDATFANNVTSPLVFFASLVISAGSGQVPTFTITGTPFSYNPAAGNLLLDVMYSNANGAGYFFRAENLAPGSVSRVFGGGATGNSDEIGLVTRFEPAVITATPEPASIVLTATGLVAFLTVMHRRKRSAA